MADYPLNQYVITIRRFDPEPGGCKRRGLFALPMPPGARLLDALETIKADHDSSLAFRRSCGHGVCGSCAVRVNGRNMLACRTLMKDLPHEIRIEPLRGFPVIRDLIVDMDGFFVKHDAVMPYLVNDEPPPERERLQSQAEQERILEPITCIMCGCCSSSCPIYRADGEYLGPSALLKAARFISDSRDRAGGRRLEKISGPDGLWRCHGIFECVESCPKDIDITGRIGKLKRLAVKKAFSGGKSQ